MDSKTEIMYTLAERANEGLLSDDERAEYEALINVEDFVAILKLMARRQLADAGSRRLPLRKASRKPKLRWLGCSTDPLSRLRS